MKRVGFFEGSAGITYCWALPAFLDWPTGDGNETQRNERNDKAMSGKTIVGVLWGLAFCMLPAWVWLAADWRLGAGAGVLFSGALAWVAWRLNRVDLPPGATEAPAQRKSAQVIALPKSGGEG